MLSMTSSVQSVVYGQLLCSLTASPLLYSTSQSHRIRQKGLCTFKSSLVLLVVQTGSQTYQPVSSTRTMSVRVSGPPIGSTTLILSLGSLQDDLDFVDQIIPTTSTPLKFTFEGEGLPQLLTQIMDLYRQVKFQNINFLKNDGSSAVNEVLQ